MKMTIAGVAMTNESKRRLSPYKIAAAVVLALLLIYPFWASDYQISVARDALIFGILALSLDFLWGKAGILSFGQAAFFGIGAYAVAIIGPRVGGGDAFLCGLLVGLILAGAVAGAVGYFLLYGGVRGPYLTIVTLALSLVAERIATGWAEVTGGDAGLLGSPPPGLAVRGLEVSLRDPLSQYFLVIAVLAGCLIGILQWCRGQRGIVLAALQDSELKLRALGYDTAGRLLMVFVASAMIAAFAGALYAGVSSFVAPDLVGLLLSTQAIVWVAVGGRGTLFGPILGAFFVTRLQTEISSISYALWPLLIGLFFVALVFVFPEGLLPFVLRHFARLFDGEARR
jgi:urea transport system permease protein